MATALEITKREFYSSSHSLYDGDDNLSIEDCQFKVFTDLLEESGEFDNSPVSCRGDGLYKSRKWRLIGFSPSRDVVFDDENDDNENDEIENIENIKKELRHEWRYSIINGFFESSTKVVNTTREEIQKSVKEIVAFIEKTLDKDVVKDLSATSEFQNEIIKKVELGVLEKIDIYIITDKVITQDDLQEQIISKDGSILNIYYWDLRKWDTLKRSRSKRVPIEIDFNTSAFSHFKIDFIKKTINSSLSQYLAIFPADLIADLYERHGGRLLENNVRVFLSANRKANQAMRNTLKGRDRNVKINTPLDVLFFSFNNGLSVTADKIEFTNNKVSKIHDFQIVNGGQTTATIHYSRKRDKKDDGTSVSLENVYVPVKITEIRKDKNENYGEIVGNISRAANTQSAIKSSDFYANSSFLIDLERLVIQCPVVSSGKNKFYFFERMSGQFNVMKNSQGNPGTRAVKIWEKEHPTELKFNKIDVARWYNCLNGFPHVAAQSAEKQFVNFMENKNFEREKMSLGRMKNLIGFGMIFKRIRKLVGTKTGKQYPSMIDDSSVGMATTIYASSMLNRFTNGKIDYWGIFDHKFDLCRSLMEKARYESKIDDLLLVFIKESWKQLKAFGKTSVQEQTKKEECWSFFKSNFKGGNITSKKLERLLISEKKNKIRTSLDNENEDLKYFNQLNELISNNCKNLHNMFLVSSNNSDYHLEKNEINNFIKKIKTQHSILTKKKVKKLYLFFEDLSKKGYNLVKNPKEEICTEINIFDIGSIIFTDFKNTAEHIGNKILDAEENFDDNIVLHDLIVELKKKLDREHGLSIDDLKSLHLSLSKLKNQGIV